MKVILRTRCGCTQMQTIEKEHLHKPWLMSLTIPVGLSITLYDSFPSVEPFEVNTREFRFCGKYEGRYPILEEVYIPKEKS